MNWHSAVAPCTSTLPISVSQFVLPIFGLANPDFVRSPYTSSVSDVIVNESLEAVEVFVTTTL